jgi:hypothetical protein
MSTIDPITTREVARILGEKGAEMLDAPVARGVPAAVSGTLVIYVGGKKEVFDRYRPILAAMGTDIYHAGDIGSGREKDLNRSAARRILAKFLSHLEGLFPGCLPVGIHHFRSARER